MVPPALSWGGRIDCLKGAGMGFTITGGRGFHITFENGFTVSVQFGPGNYCEHYDGDILAFTSHPPRLLESIDAEIAVWGPDGNLIKMPGWGDTVNGRQSPKDVLELLNWAAGQKA